MFSLSGLCELLFLLCFIVSWTCLSCVPVNCLVKQFAICFGVVVIECYWGVLVWVEVLCWIDRVWSSKECA